jgi:dGTPase
MEFIGREARERQEHEFLSEQASFADQTDGRDHAAILDEYRTEYQRDRDRLIHCKAFRRLSHKTQVFLAPVGDHYRTRLTHTLEVAQIARTIARALGLNEDLTEAISYGHDLGHTPFGHTGEEALSLCIVKRLGQEGSTAQARYRHNEQSLRVVEVIERGGFGLNLTFEVRDGIVCHTGKARARTMEGRIVAAADRIAYVNHDIDDAIRAGIIDEVSLPESTHAVLGSSHSNRIATLVGDMITNSAAIGDISMSQPVWGAMMELRAYLFDRVYTSQASRIEGPKVAQLMMSLFEYFLAHMDEVPEENRRIAAEHPSVTMGDDVECTAVVDYLASMTDRYAKAMFETLFVPHNWNCG